MHLITIPLAVCLLFTGCKKDIPVSAGEPTRPERYVATALDPDWPYRYTLDRDQGKWSGEVEVGDGEARLYFDTMQVVSSSDSKIEFGALIGGAGKAVGMSWELTLAPSSDGFEGVLRMTGSESETDPVRLKLVRSPDAVMPSSQVDSKLRSMDDAGYRTEGALRHEVRVAKEEWERESEVVANIAALRRDDGTRKGIRTEWVGPGWVLDRVSPEDSKYFERIVCVYLGGTSVTDEEVREISRLPALRELFLHHTGITDAALGEFEKLRSLRILHLRNTLVSDEGLEKLRALVHLEELYLFETRVSDEGGQRLREQLPDARIEW